MPQQLSVNGNNPSGILKSCGTPGSNNVTTRDREKHNDIKWYHFQELPGACMLTVAAGTKSQEADAPVAVWLRQLPQGQNGKYKKLGCRHFFNPSNFYLLLLPLSSFIWPAAALLKSTTLKWYWVLPCSLFLIFSPHLSPPSVTTTTVQKNNNKIILSTNQHSLKKKKNCKYLSKVADIKQIKCFKEFTFLHPKCLTTGQKERSYILQTKKLKKKSSYFSIHQIISKFI